MTAATDPKTAATVEADEQLLDASGHMHVHDAPIDLTIYPFEAWIAFAFFIGSLPQPVRLSRRLLSVESLSDQWASRLAPLQLPDEL